MLSVLFTARSIMVFSLVVNIGALLLVTTYFCTFLMYKIYEDEKKFVLMLRNNFAALVLMIITASAFVKFTSVDLEGDKSHFDWYLVNRVPQIFLVVCLFYFGQLLLALSFRLYESTNILLDFALRVFVVMQIQSFMYYSMINLYFLNVPIDKAIELYMNGLIFRGVLIFAVFTPIYYYITNKCKVNSQLNYSG